MVQQSESVTKQAASDSGGVTGFYSTVSHTQQSKMQA